MPIRDASGTIHARRLFIGGGASPLEDQIIVYDHGRIHAIRKATTADGRERGIEQADIVAPGFIDLQINGAGGRQFNHDPTVETLRVMAETARQGGTAHILPTFVTAPDQDYVRAIAATKSAIDQQVAGILGLHLEGPFLSSARPGIHPPEAIRPISADDLKLICSAARDLPLLLTLAPEVLLAGVLETLIATGVIVFAGHSEASADQMATAEAVGLRGATHLFNAMSQLTARAPGVVGAVLASDRLFAGIIADGQHVDWRSLKVACRIMGNRLFLVTDAMQTLGGTRRKFLLGDRPITLKHGRLQDDKGTLAGAHIDMASSVRNLVTHCDVPLAGALDMASGGPAAAFGQAAALGCIRVGATLSLTLLAEDLSVQGVRVTA